MCRFCWNTINENLNGKCPACRQPYNEENFQFIPPNPQECVSIQLKTIEIPPHPAVPVRWFASWDFNAHKFLSSPRAFRIPLAFSSL